jgi:formyl-CoA transferase/CoA:oxalate CoA-transferase
VGTEKLWAAFCAALDLGHLQDDPRFATNADRTMNRDDLLPVLDKLFSTHGADYWLAKLKDTGIPNGPINEIADTLAHPQHRARSFIVELEHPLLGLVRSMGNPVNLSTTPVSYRLAPPTLGQHTEDVLRELGYEPNAVAAMQEEGIV